MDSYCAPKNSGFDEQPKAPIRQPVRVHELMGLPKSAGKIVEQQRLQPVRIKYLLESTGSCSKETTNSAISARRTTLARTGSRNIRRQLYTAAVDETYAAEKSMKDLNCSSSHGNLQPVRVGLSKSDGKVKTNDHRLQPIRVMHLLESWEKSQTAKPAGPKSISGRGVTNVRRKLYSVVSTPASSKKVRKSLAPNRIQEATTSNKAEKIIKPDAGKSARNATQKSRKSCLLPPNSIRDKHIKLKAKETIVEESPSAISPESSSNTDAKTNIEETKLEIENASEINEIAACAEKKSSLSVESIVAGSSQQDDKVFEGHVEIPRPSVIMNLATSTATKNRSESVPSESSGKTEFEISRASLQKLNSYSTMPLVRLDAVDTSLQDLLGNSQSDRQDSLGTSNLPCNSFLRNFESGEKSLEQIDSHVLSWLHGNVKLCVQMTEESLFCMKKIQNTIEDILSKNSMGKSLKNGDDVVEEIPKIVVTNSEVIGDKCQENIAASFPISFVNDKESFEGNKESCDEIQIENDKENLPAENGEKPRRRSARLKAMQMISPDDSFSRIEADLNISHKKAKAPTPRKTTPAKRKQADPRSRKSIREYMALKASSNFLLTPDVNGLPTPNGNKTGTPAQRQASARAFSRKLLCQLDDLYADSP